MALGDYVKTTYVNGGPPGISAERLNNNENKTEELDRALAAHKSRHATGGADALTPADIGAAQLGSDNQAVNLFKALNQQIDTRNIALTYDASGNLTTVTEKDGATTVKITTLAYSSGRLSTVTEQVGGKTITTTLNYDANGNLISVTRSVV